MFSHKHGADTTFDETDADYKNTNTQFSVPIAERDNIPRGQDPY